VRDARVEHSVRLGAMLALWAPLHGHVCFDVADRSALGRGCLATGEQTDDDEPAVLPWPETDAWLAALRDSPLVRVVEVHDANPVLDSSPLVLCGSRLYAQRQWVDECLVVASMRARAAVTTSPLQRSARRVLDELLPPRAGGRPNLQHTAAAMAAERLLTVITGGPGSGKTHTIARLIVTLLADAEERGERSEWRWRHRPARQRNASVRRSLPSQQVSAVCPTRCSCACATSPR
jgi:exodeoxyribonuclease V alpha subunit